MPVASDAQTSPSWQAIIHTPNARLGKRTLHDFEHRPAEELYDLRADPDEVVYLARDAARCRAEPHIQGDARPLAGLAGIHA